MDVHKLDGVREHNKDFIFRSVFCIRDQIVGGRISKGTRGVFTVQSWQRNRALFSRSLHMPGRLMNVWFTEPSLSEQELPPRLFSSSGPMLSSNAHPHHDKYSCSPVVTWPVLSMHMHLTSVTGHMINKAEVLMKGKK